MSPDLSVLIRSKLLTRERGKAIVADISGLDRHIAVSTHGLRSLALDVWAHDILSADADWNASVWAFDPAELDRLEATISRISVLLPEGFTLEACWGRLRPKTEVAVTRDEFMSLVSSNRLGNRVLYRVSGHTGR